ncbi:hypothetical protein DC083_03650 [Ignatzschineria ureiclastica]|uniref:Uncharacterized protein n=1 Tax=Ignatzschineria ureiclastica TaxID=472582 RepID=A0A2U2AG54_9GAMM|nr:hypothetical protein DC083_03650 [Ignatzschineria ureiclastica]
MRLRFSHHFLIELLNKCSISTFCRR